VILGTKPQNRAFLPPLSGIFNGHRGQGFQGKKKEIPMDVVEAIRSRKSIRKYKPEPIPKHVLSEMLEIASRAPSAVNSQPWEFLVIAGDVLEKIKKANVEKLHSGQEPQSENIYIGWTRNTVYYKRQVDLANRLFDLMDIERGDREKRIQWMERGFRYFDAPAAIIILTDRAVGESPPLFDLGLVSQTICLAALNYGLCTCIEGQGTMYPEILRETAGIPKSKRIAIAIAIGYPDVDFPANQIETPREPVDSLTTWLGF